MSKNKEVKPEVEQEVKPATMEERVADLEEGMASLVGGFNKMVGDISHDLTSMANALHKAYSVSVGAQILSETVARYLAGYNPGDFSKEFEDAMEKGKIDELKMTSHGDSFDVERFLALAKETAQVFVKIREEEIRRRKEAAEKADEAAKSKITQLEKPKIIIP